MNISYSSIRNRLAQAGVSYDTSHLSPEARARVALAQLKARQLFEEDEVIRNLRANLGM